MDELCRMMKNSHVLCVDENHTNLHKSYEICQDLIRNKSPIYQVRSYLKSSKIRYAEYLLKARMTSSFHYIKHGLEEFCHLVHDETPEGAFMYLLLLSYFVDTQLLLSIGDMTLSNSENM